MSDTKPVFLFVPGGFQGPPHFEPIIDALRKRGYQGYSLWTPGTGDDVGTAPPLESVKGVRAKVEELVNAQKKEVVIVGCSYGGFIASMSVKGFEKSAKQASGNPGGVKHIAFVAALVIPEDTIMVASLGGGGLPAWCELDEKEGLLRPSKVCSSIFFSDLDEAAQKHWETFMKPVTPRDSTAVVKNACWDVDIPKTHIYTTNDKTLPIEEQQKLVEQVVKPRPNDWSFETMHSDHSPFLSHVEDFADVLVKLAT